MKSIALTLIYLLIFNSLRSQSLWVEMNSNYSTIGPEHLAPPHTAGANYASTIPLQTEAQVTLTGVDENTAWCLFVRRMSTPTGQATLRLEPDYNNLLPQQWDPNSPAHCPLEALPNPCFSGIGPVESLTVHFLLENASLDTDWQLRTEDILWTVESGGCPSGP